MIRDLDADTTTRVSEGWPARSSPAISADGRFVAFDSTSPNLHPDDSDTATDVFVQDRQMDTTTLVSRASRPAGATGNGSSVRPSMSADGRLVAFESGATNLHPDDRDAYSDVFVRDVQMDRTPW